MGTIKRAAAMTAEQYRMTASESETQKVIVAALRYAGYTVLTTDRHRRGGGGPDGISRGLPDVLAWDPNRAGWVGLEVKKPSGGRLSAEQRALVHLGAVTVVRSVEDAMAAMGRDGQ